MTKVGEFPVQRSDGTYDDVELYAPGTFDHEPLLVQLSDGRWGTPYLRPLGDGDTGLLVQDSTGTWWQVNQQGILVIEDWESGTRDTDTWNWTDSDFSGSMSVHGDDTHWQGSYGLDINGFARTISMPSYPNPLPHYPGVGDSFEYYFKIPGSTYLGSGQQYWFHFLVQDCPHHTTTSAGNTDYSGGYTVEAIMGDTFRVQRRNEDGSVDGDSSTHETVNWSANTWYRVEVDVANFPSATLEEHVGGGDFNTLVTATTNYSSPWSSGGLGPRGSGDGRVYLDTFRQLPA